MNVRMFDSFGKKIKEQLENETRQNDASHFQSISMNINFGQKMRE
jgi:hypothetical protein